VTYLHDAKPDWVESTASFLESLKCLAASNLKLLGFAVVVSDYFEITAASVAPNRNRILPLRFDFKDCLNASLNCSSG
jgi:hypothetical protein